MQNFDQTAVLPGGSGAILSPGKLLLEVLARLEERTSFDVLMPFQKAVQQVLVARGAFAGQVDIGDYKLHHLRVAGPGKGPPLLLVHGLAGTAASFSRILFPLAQRYRQVWAVDLPGHGFSPPPRRGKVTLERQLAALQRFHQEVIGEPVVLVGNSLGGAMTMELAAKAPDRVRGIALLAPAGAQVPPERFEELIQCLRVQTPAETRALLRRLFVQVPPLALAIAGQLKKMYGCDSVRSLLDDALARPFLDPQTLGAIKQPVLLLWGGSEKLLPAEGVDYFRTHLPPHAQVEVVKGWGHVPQLEHPAAVVDRLTRFADEAGF